MNRSPKRASSPLPWWVGCTAILLIASLLVAHAQQPFASRTSFLKEKPSRVEEKLKMRDPDPSDTIEKMLIEENNILNRVSGFSTELHMGEGGTCAHPEAGIIVDRSDLTDIFRSNNVSRFREIIRFVLAHEKAHMFQFRRWSESKGDTDEETNRLYEAHADILAGKFVEEMMYPQADGSVPTEVMDVAFGLSNNRFAHGTHPSKQERRDSARLGLACGIILNMERLAQPQALESANILRQKLNVRKTDDVMEWALRTAKRNIAYTGAAVASVQVERPGDNSIHFDTNPAHPVVDYRLVYSNKGNTPLRVDLEVACMSVSRSDPADKTQWQKWSCQFYTFTLAPGQSRTVSDRLQWYGDKQFMPSLKYGGSTPGMLSAEFTGPRVVREGGSGGLHEVAEALTTNFREYRGRVKDRGDSYTTYISSAPSLQIGDINFGSEITEWKRITNCRRTIPPS